MNNVGLPPEKRAGISDLKMFHQVFDLQEGLGRGSHGCTLRVLGLTQKDHQNKTRENERSGSPSRVVVHYRPSHS
jgi:hypothetical protein